MTRTQKLTLVATGLGLFMVFLDALIVNVALPDIQSSLEVGESGLQWVVTAYSLGMAMFIMSGATVADLHGRKRLYLAGLIVFVAGSVASGVAPNLLVLDLARFVQGAAAAVVTVTSLALVSAAFTDADDKAKAIGIWTAIASVGTSIGPTVGGLLTDGIGWRSIFLVNVPVGIAAVILTVSVVAESRDPNDRGLDPVGQVLFVVGIGAFAFAIIQGPVQGWVSPVILVLFAASAIALVAFTLVELRSDDPLMDVRLFADSTYTLAIVTIFVAFFAVYGMLLVVTQYFQNVEDLSAVEAGLLVLPFSAAIVVLSPVVGRLVARTGSRPLILIGLAALAVGLGVVLVGVDVGPWLVAVGLIAVGAGAALQLTPITSLAMSSVPPDRSGMASGIMSAQRAIGSTVGYAVLGSILAVWLSATLSDDLAPVIPDAGERAAVTDAIVATANPDAYAAEVGPGRPLGEPPTSVDDQILAIADADFVQGIQVALGLAVALEVLMLGIGVWRFPGRAGEEVGEDAEASTLEAEEARREAGAG